MGEHDVTDRPSAARPEAAGVRYLAASTIEEAVAAMVEGARPIAGGTDLLTRANLGYAPLPAQLVGIHRIPDLAVVEDLDPDRPGRGLRLGALVTHASVATHPRVRARYRGLADASAIVGTPGVRGVGTLGGAVMNDSPASDVVAPLLCHGAVAVLHGPRGVRRVELDELWGVAGRIAVTPDELLVSLELPEPPSGEGLVTGSAYVRLQPQFRKRELAIAGVAVTVTVALGEIVDARIAIAALAPTVRRMPTAEHSLLGAPALGEDADAVGRVAGACVAEACEPMRADQASVAHWRALGAAVTRRAVIAAVARARGETIRVPASEANWGN